ncbi:MAG: processive 1,2-diacylglycerol beta-glucosyltransferase [Tepidanaerobacteraceae bacterium]|nr:processive 1,2-diacylglycerol beta-glucosyltransferase [Tepidanaerobacteraceae bacterium]
MKNGKVLILSEKFGTGHEKAAISILKGIKKVSPDTGVRIINFFHYCQPYFSRMTLNLYLKALDIRPEIWGYFYERERNKKRATFPKKMIQMGASSILRKIIEKEAPDVIVCTHPFPCCVASRLKRRGQLFALAEVITDFDVHGFWINEGVDAYLVAHEIMIEPMLKFGVDADKIFATGIPIDPNFDVFKGKNAVKKTLGFDKGLPVLLMAGGGLGLSGIDGVLVETLAREPLQIAVICGKNRLARRRLEDVTAKKALDNVKVYGFVENMWDFMEAADLMITKAGGLTMAEALTRELPIIIYNPLPGQEERNARFLLRNGAARYARDRDVLIKLVRDMLLNEKKLLHLKSRGLRLKKTGSAQKAAEIVLDLMEKNNSGWCHGIRKTEGS